jgi:hypothetical protein
MLHPTSRTVTNYRRSAPSGWSRGWAIVFRDKTSWQVTATAVVQSVDGE